MPAFPSAALRRVERDAAADETDWLPLTLALEYAAAHPTEPASRTGPALLQQFFARLSGDPAAANG